MRSDRIKFGVQIRPGTVARLVEQALLCEKVGFDSVWWMDHIIGGPPTINWPELFTSLAVLGEKTRRVTIGSAVTDILRRHPVTVAQACASIQQSTGGRFILGLGAGEAMNLAPFGISMDHPYTRLEEAIRVMRLLWSGKAGEPIDFTGAYYSMKNAFLQVESESPPRVYLGAFGPRMLKLAGRLCDGWLPWSQTPETYTQILNDSILRESEKTTQASHHFEPCSINITCVSETSDEARRASLPHAKQMLAILSDQIHRLDPRLKHPGREFTALGTMGPAASKEKQNIMANFVESIPDEIAQATAIYGTPDECVEKIEKLSRAGCAHFIFSVRGTDTDQVIVDLAKKVLPYFVG